MHTFSGMPAGALVGPDAQLVGERSALSGVYAFPQHKTSLGVDEAHWPIEMPALAAVFSFLFLSFVLADNCDDESNIREI